MNQYILIAIAGTPDRPDSHRIDGLVFAVEE